MKKFLLVVLTLFISHVALSQCMQIEIPLADRINASSIIVEGEVISKQSYWDAKRQNIFTVNTVKPFKTFKGILSNTAPLEIITMGGIVGNTRLDVSNALQLNAGDVGMFLLKASSISLTKSGNFLTTVEDSQGYIKYDRYDASASDGFKRYTSVISELYPLIESSVGRSFTTLETVNLFQETSNRRAGSISNISPTNVNAGVSDILTINGSGFGSSQGHVDFIDANDDGTTWISTFPSDIISWSATQIKVKVISRASTGLIRIIDSSSGIAQSSQVLTVNWAHSNPNIDTGSGEIRYENSLRAKDANGGYEFKFAPNFSATNAQDSFNRALATWNCGSGVNFEIGGTTTVDEIASDGTNVIVYQALGLGTLASALTWSGYCTINGVVQGWYVSEIDIRVNSNQNWHYGNGTPGDPSKFNFETVALHELGHAHQLGHVGQSDDVMYYALSPGVRNAVLTTETLNGAEYVFNKSTTTSVCGQPVMTPYSGSICCSDPEIATHPNNVTNCTNDIETFSITANYATNYQWQVNTGTAWTTITNNTTYSGAQSTTLSVTNIITSMNGYQYRCIASNSCTNTATSNAATLTADKPEVTLSATEETPCDTNDGTITFTFPDNPNRTGIQFSIDGGANYTGNYDDNSGSVTLTDLAPNTYSVYSRWGNGQCEVEVGDITVVEKNNPEATVASSTPTGCSDATGSATITWVVDPIRTHIEFSTDGGVTYPHNITNPSGTITIDNLPAGTTDLWVRWGNAECPIDMEDVTIANSNCDFSNGFISTWETANAGTSNSNSITIPIASTGAYNYHVDWGDGQSNYNVTTGITHAYATAGTYQVKIVGDFPQIQFANTGDRRKIVSIDQWGSQTWQNMDRSFYGCSNLVINATDNPDLSQVTSFSQIFRAANALNQDISDWVVTNVTNMSEAFNAASNFNQDLSGWDVSNVTDMSYMFGSASAFNQDISNWNVSNVRVMDGMFSAATAFNQNIGDWNVSNVFVMQVMFSNAFAFDQDLGNWDISEIQSLSGMFNNITLSTSNYDKTLIGWNTKSATEARVPGGISFSAGNSRFCNGEAARNELRTRYGWNIFDSNFKDCSSAFVTTWKTDNTGVSNDNSITIPTNGTDPYNYTVDWGDGTISSNLTASETHQYATAGTYTVTITGDYPWFWSGNTGDKDKLLSVDQWGDQVWSTMHASFYGCSNVVINATDTPDLSQVTSFYRVFREATAINQAIIGTWNVSTITNMEQAFTGAATFNQDLSGWNMSNVTSTLNMFSNALTFNQDISGWDVGNVTNIAHMFRSAIAFNQPIGSWDVKNVDLMNRMFEGATAFNQDLSNWDVSKVTTMFQLFLNATAFDQDLGAWDISSVTSMVSMFEGVTLSTSNYDATLIGWNNLDTTGANPETQIPENITFHGGNSTFCAGEAARTSLMSTPYSWTITDGNKDCPDDTFITTWQTTTANETITIPTTGTGYNYDIDWDNNGTFDDFGVTGDATHTFATPGVHTVTISGNFPRIYFNNTGDKDKIQSVEQWGVITWESMENAFYGCSNLVINAIDSPDLSLTTSFSRIFSGATTLNQDISAWDVSTITNMNNAFENASSFNQSLNDWVVGNVTSMEFMFYKAAAFNGNIISWDVSSVTSMFYMFKEASVFNQDIGDWIVSSVTNMNVMFGDAIAFNQDISTWIVSSVDQMGSMFSDASSFNQDIGNWDVSNVFVTLEMFKNATAFDQDLGAWDISSMFIMDDMFSGATLSVTNYDNTLIGWSTISGDETIPSNIMFNGGFSKYCNAAAAISLLTSQEHGWTIMDEGTACPVSNNFITTWETTVASETITIPTTGSGYNYDIDWDNDGAFDDFGVAGDATHTYATAGTHTVSIRGDFPRIYFNNVGDKDKIQSVEQWGTIAWESMARAFYGCSNLVINATDNPDLSSVTDMSFMLSNASVFNQDISAWDVSSVINMSSMFRGASTFNQDISTWNVGSVTNMNTMFGFASSFNQDINAWDVSSVVNMYSMFNQANAFNQNLNSWNVSSVVNMYAMFYQASAFNQDLSNWNVSSVTDMDYMFNFASAFNQDLGNWDISSVISMTDMFLGVTLSINNYDNTLIGWNNLVSTPSNINFHGGNSNYCAGEAARANLISTQGHSWTITDGNLDCVHSYFITTWETTTNGQTLTIPTIGTGYNYDIDWDNNGTFDDLGVTGDATHTYATSGTHTITIKGDFPRIYFDDFGDKDSILSVEQWGTQTWQSMENAFYGCSNLVLNATDSPDLSSVTDMSYMFSYALAFNQDISAWDVSSVTEMDYMFELTEVFNQDLSTWDVSNVTTMESMFTEAYAFNGDISTWDVSSVTNMRDMFSFASDFNQNIGGWNVANVLSMDDMFWEASSFNQDLSTWDVSNVTTMESMFEDASVFNGNISTWDVSSVTTMQSMFDHATVFNVNISNWDVSSVANMISMFNNASAFNQNIGGWNVSSVTNMAAMFFGASVFNQDLVWNVSIVTDMGSMFNSAEAFNGNISSWNVASVTDMSLMFAGAIAFNQDIGSWNVGNVTNMELMFIVATAFNQDIGNWDVSNVTTMEAMFAFTSAFDQDLGAWDISNITTMAGMFDSTALSTANYDNTLIGWNTISGTETIPTGITFSAGNSKYCNGETAKNNLVGTPHSWNIIDDGLDCSSIIATYFITTWETTVASETITIPTTGAGYNYDIDWDNDGVFDDLGVTGNATHTYATPGIQTVTIRGVLPRVFFAASSDKNKLLSVEQWGTGVWTSMYFAFAGCNNLVINATDAPDLSNVTSMGGMFAENYSLNQDITHWNVSNVTDMSGLFDRALTFNQNISNWDVSSVTNMRFMFNSARDFNQDLGSWDISNVTDMTNMFSSVKLSTSNYDNTLIGWNTLSGTETQIPSGITFSGGNSNYCAGEAARDNLTNPLGHSWTITDAGRDCAEVSPKVVLQGAALNPNSGEETLMRDDLRVAGLLPTTSPYADALVANATVFNTGGTSGIGANADNIVDWVYVELRDKTNNTVVLAGQSALVQRDGDVVSINGLSSLEFDLGADNYYVAIKHRNHLGIMTANTIVVDASDPVIDFTDANNQITFGTNAQSTFGMPTNTVGMWAGDSNGDGRLNYLGSYSENITIRNQVFNDPNNSVFGGPPSATYSSVGYLESDVDMNGYTKFLGDNNDVLSVRNNTFNNPSNSIFNGPPSPTFVFTQQLPEGANE